MQYFLGRTQIANIPIVMGVINLSPESFYKSSVGANAKEILTLAQQHLREGATLLDIGARSTAPRSIYGEDNEVSEELECERVLTALQLFQEYSEFDTIDISVDTQRSKVAEVALSHGATIINDISGFKADSKILSIIADNDASAIAMAAKGKPGDVWTLPDIISALQQSLSLATSANIEPNRVIIDPGIGSWNGRDYLHDFTILRQLDQLSVLQKPILVGISRKTFIGKVLAAPPEGRLYGSLAATTWALIHGAKIIRTHDTRPVVDTIKILKMLEVFV